MARTAAVHPREDRKAAGIVLMAGAVLFFTLIDTSAKWLILTGLPLTQVVLARYVGHFLSALIYYGPGEGLGGLRSRAPGRQALRSLFLLGGTVFNFLALSHLPLTVTTTIFFAGPVVVTLLSIPVLGERPGLRRMVAVALGFCGVLIVVQPWGAVWHPAMVFSLLALLCASLYYVMTRALAGIEGEAVSQYWPSGLAALAVLPLALPDWVWPQGVGQWAVFLLIGVLGQTGHAMANTAHRLADASLLAPIVYSQMLWATIIGVTVFATWPTVWTLLGGFVIIASGLYLWHHERRRTRG